MRLSVIQCELSPEIEKLFNALPKLKKVYLGSPKIHESTLNAWKRKFPKIDFSNEIEVNEPLPLTPPIFQNEQAILEVGDSIRLIHPVKGAHIWYTTDGTTPDSIHGKRYQMPFAIHQMAEIKALAVKNGWITSLPVTLNAYTSGLTPEKVRMLSQSASQYPGRGESTFTNKQLAPISNTRDANWIGYREESCIVEVTFDTPVSIQKVALNFACHIPQYIFPPTKIKVFGGPNSQSMKLLGTKILKPVTPAEKEKVAAETSQVILTGNNCRVYRIEAYNLPFIPPWHPGKGEKGWLFIDEIFFYN
jgi:mRNA-degrading endonuclease HigB of HigAB toxin-antitoxin module